MKFNNRKSGFTLAEVLVTLMIIGVIAAMTIPSLMQSTAQQEYKAAFKKAVSMLNQAITLNYALDGRDASDYSGTSLFNLMTARLNIMSSNASTTEFYTADGMWFKVLNTGEKNSNVKNNSCTTTSDNPNDVNNTCAAIKVDVNGQKGPNTWTTGGKNVKDMFEVAVYPQKVLPSNTQFAEALYAK